MNSQQEQDVNYWKAKFEESQKKLEILKPLAADGVSAYDELFRKFESNQTQYKKLQARLKEKDDQLAQMKNLFEPVYNEYDDLQTRYSIEATCRAEVENYASKITKENKVLRRQSQAFLSQTGGVVPVEKEADLYKEHAEKMNAKIKELEDEITELKRKVRENEDGFQEEKLRADKGALRLQKTVNELEQSKKTLKQHEKALEELANCSEAAYTEFQSLRKKYDLEMQCRSRAEEYASKMHCQTEAMKRQSSILLMSVASDQKLVNALTAVEEVNEKLEELKQKHSTEVQSLTEELNEAKQGNKVVSLEEDIVRLEQENESLQKKIEEFNTQYTDLTNKYKTLEDKYENAMRPPPPPPIPVQFAQAKKNVSDIIREKRQMKAKKLEVGGVKTSESYAKAIEEMMNRIQGGRPVLKSTNNNNILRRPSAPDEVDSSPKNCAMDELQNIFKKIKRNHSEGDIIEDTESSEFTQTFNRIKGNESSTKDKVSEKNLSRVDEERESQISINRDEENPVF